MKPMKKKPMKKQLSPFGADIPSWVLITVFVCLAVFSLTACSSEQEVFLKADGSGRSRIEIEVHPFFVQYLRDLTAGLAESPADGAEFRVFDEFRIADSFNRIDGLLLEDFQRLGPGHIVIEASFTDPSGILPPPVDPSAPPVLDLRSNGDGSRTLGICLSPGNIDSLYGLLGVEEQQNMLSFGPQPEPLSEEEYVDMMVYAMGTYADPEELEGILRSRRVEISFSVEGTIISAEGLERRGEKAVLSLPFLRPATLEEPVRFSLTWKD